MGFFIFWIGSIILCFWTEFKYEFRMFKDIADAGYKVNFDRLNELKNYIDANIAKKNILSLFIPLYNLGVMTKKLALYPKIQPHLVDSLLVLDVCEKMDRYEQKEYEKKPTGLNAILVSAFWEKRISLATILTYEEETGISEIYYEKNKAGEITILKVNGPASKFSDEEQQQIIRDAYTKLKEKIVEEAWEILMKSDTKDSDSERKLDEYFLQTSIEERRKFLEELFKRLQDEQKKRIDEKEQSLVRKRNRKD